MFLGYCRCPSSMKRPLLRLAAAALCSSPSSTAWVVGSAGQRPIITRWIPSFNVPLATLSLMDIPSTSRLFSTASTTTMSSESSNQPSQDDWQDVLPMEPGSHNSMRITVPPPAASSVGLEEEEDNTNLEEDPFDDVSTFATRLQATMDACVEMQKSSLWLEIPMSRGRLLEACAKHGTWTFHHAMNDTAVLNVWLRPDQESKVPVFATHKVGVGAVVINEREEILVVRELRKNYMPYKLPTGLANLGEPIEQAGAREVWEETGIQCQFHSVLGFRETHGLAHGRSDMFFVCRYDLVPETNQQGDTIIPEPVPQEDEIAEACWMPLSDYRDLVYGRGQYQNDNDDKDGNKPKGHPMMKHILDAFDAERRIEKKTVHSVVPGRKPNAIYVPTASSE